MKIKEATAREVVTKREKLLKKKLIALLKDDGRGHKHAAYAARLEDFIIKIVSLEEDPEMTAAISFEEATIYISEGFLRDPNIFYQLNVLMRHELAHYLMMHQIRMTKKLEKKFGKIGADRIGKSHTIHDLFNTIEDLEISNTRYSKADKELVKHLILNGREISGLVTESIRADWVKLSVEEMYDKLEAEIKSINDSILARWDQLDLQTIGKAKDYIHTDIKRAHKYINIKDPTNFFGPVDKFIKNQALYHFIFFDRVTSKGIIPCVVKYSALTDTYQNIIKDAYNIIINGNEVTGKPYTKQQVRDIITEIAKSSIIDIYVLKNEAGKELITLYTPEEKLLAIDTFKAMLPTLEEYETWYEKVKKTLGDSTKYSKDDLEKILAALENKKG